MYYSVRPATRFDALNMASRLRLEDAREIRSASGKEPKDVLPDCVVNHKAFVLEVAIEQGMPGVMLALFGVTDGQHGFGIPWLVATPLIIHHQLYFLRHCKRWIDRLFEGYTVLGNCVDARNSVHIKWLKWCGFTFTTLHPEWGAEKLPFWQFERNKSNV